MTGGQRDAVDGAASFSANLLLGSWSEAVAEQAAGMVSDRTYRQLFGGPDPRDCRVLAKLAAALLAGQDRLHQECGAAIEALSAGAGVGRVRRRFARELGRRLPLPWDGHITATARGLQVSGIVLCLDAGRPLTSCRCFVDLAVDQTKEHLKQVLAAAAQDWTKLA